MKSSTILGLAMLAALVAAAPEQVLSRGGGGGGGGGGRDFGGGDVGGGDRGYSGGGDSWHGGGSEAVGGTWHSDGYHADAYYSGYGGAAAVNHYYANGCYNCGGGAAWASATAMATGYAIGTTVVTPPAGAECQHETVVGVHYYVCGTTWFRPYAGNNGLYYKVVAAPR